MTEQQEAFEAWVRSRSNIFIPNLTVNKSGEHEGKYRSAFTQERWEAFRQGTAYAERDSSKECIVDYAKQTRKDADEMMKLQSKIYALREVLT